PSVDRRLQLAPQRVVEWAPDEVVRDAGSDLLARLIEVPNGARRPIEGARDGRRPGCRKLRREQPRRPSAEEHTPPAEAVRKAGKASGDVAPPRETPDLCPEGAGVCHDRTRGSEARQRQVLDVSREQEPARLEDEDPVAAGPVRREQMLGKDRPERA